MIGIVKEVFIPDEEIDKIYSTKIGFKILINNKELIIIQEQDKINSNIFRGDKVIVIKTSDNTYDIELYDEV